MKKDKETKKRRYKAGNGSLAFYIMAVIFLLLGIYAGISSYMSLAQTAESYGVAMTDVMSSMIYSIVSSIAPYFGFGCILYGIGVILKKLPVQGEE